MTDILKLSAYVAERARHRGHSLTEQMLELFAERRVTTSVVLRGIASFGPQHIVRTDESLTLSEDLPALVLAADTAEVIAPLAEQVGEMLDRGLLVVEHAELVDCSLPEFARHRDAVRLTAYFSRRQRVAGVPAHIAATALLHRLGFSGVITYLGVDGTAAGERHRAGFFSRNANVPLTLLAVGSREQARAAAAELRQMFGGPFVTAEQAQICKADGALLSRPLPLPDDQLLQKLMVYTDENWLHDGEPVHRALIRRLRDSPCAGATVLRGVWGYCGQQRPHGDQLTRLTRAVPVSTTVIDTAEGIEAAFDIIDELTAEHGLVTSERVPAAVAVHGRNRSGSTRLRPRGNRPNG
ncbi:DUF190 domain-containing protein [Mycolicibacterium brumae]|uniref:DUF190 domain-containing protein n=1 Tax=Mycolicibacterium brumae TaxID=85968 RepID=A0A2G5P899_9MYCO|nr:DUF190 domain-containing protein [Mycolicibacterium brumae]MCV7191309.1 DUF190 domain-containing protein [Mycolicibacterium brumae]PIB74572.1 hypothetical protein CQY22_012820 [Mycolicibacterium brumae]RWA18948.1 hypothetical protein MBRU_17645 [Mycolicibacterium brumae DSM 44177]UWW09592.1 DUF190 domain-containing protein [Mycolicibacterium brumae]